MLDKLFKSPDAAGAIATFMAMSYVLAINPKILHEAGLPYEVGLMATILVSIFGCLMMGYFANKPFAVSTYIGESAFIAYTVCDQLKYSYKDAFLALFVAAAAFFLLTVFGLREKLIQAIPFNLKIAFTSAIGIFLTSIGLKETGLLDMKIDMPESLAIVAIVSIIVLMILRVRSAILAGMVIVTVLAVFFGEIELPRQLFSSPIALDKVLLLPDLSNLKLEMTPIIFAMFVMIFADTTGSILGVASRGKMLDKQANLPDSKKVMLADSLTTLLAPLLGNAPSGVYLESSVGIQTGAVSGFMPIIVAILFALAIFFAPLLSTIPACAYGSALAVVGLLMFKEIFKMEFLKIIEVISGVSIIAATVYSQNIALGLSTGFTCYLGLKLLCGKWKDLNKGTITLGMISILMLFIFPY